MHYRIHVNGKPFDVVVEMLTGVAPAYGAPTPPPVAPAYVPPALSPAPVYAAAAAPVSAYATPVPTPAPVYAPPTAPVPAPAPVPAATNPGGTDIPVTSPFPGNVMQISVTVGQAVSEGQCLIILEAMKMQNEIVAPQASVVKQILVSKGATVNTDDVLIVLG